MDVGDAVAGDLTDVEHQPVPIGQPLGAGHRLRGQEQVGDLGGVVGDHRVGVGDVPLRHDQHVCGRLRVEIAEGIAALGRQDFGGWEVATDDSTEQAVVAHAGNVPGDRVPGVAHDDDLAGDLTRLIADERAIDAARGRMRERSLRSSATADAALTGVLVDLAERGDPVVVATTTGRTARGRITLVARDAVAIGRTYIRLEAVTWFRRVGAEDVQEPSGDRPAPRETTFAALIAGIAAERPRVSLGIAGDPGVLHGELCAAGRDLLTVRLDGAPPVTTYVAVSAVAELTVLAR